ncbi:PREDICTED: mannan endo-1,4-beta-mannosidase 4-like [Erythranthe guttata]|nr:PREDICTED: mannan endo-1,4-beta-mannosidase 4-like [Erythranthe guttata]|eukprot:XP_012838780.1 PREDICTED: mannan endo-1,4-beta-mannosidase 4-like [Erythranthe guttata]
MLGKSLAICFVFAALLMAYHCEAEVARDDNFIGTRGSQFVMNGRPFYFNGFNSYWLMYMASDPSTRDKVTDTFAQASEYGMNLARTWAFSDGGYRALQTSPGSYNEDMFKGLDFVVAEAKKHGIYLLLTLVNNWEGFGGKRQYVQWAKDKGHYLNNDDDFFTNSIVKQYYKNHVKAVLTRFNSITEVAYKDDPTILHGSL